MVAIASNMQLGEYFELFNFFVQSMTTQERIILHLFQTLGMGLGVLHRGIA